MEIESVFQDDKESIITFRGPNGRGSIKVKYWKEGYFQGEEMWKVKILVGPFGERVSEIPDSGSVSNRDSIAWIAARWATMFLS